MDEGLEKAQAELAQHPEDVDLYWHTGRFMFEVGERFDRSDKTIDKVAWYENMVHVFERGPPARPEEPAPAFGLGIAKGRLGTTKGVLASLFMAKDVEGRLARDRQLLLRVLEHPRAGTAAVRRVPLPRHLLPARPRLVRRRVHRRHARQPRQVDLVPRAIRSLRTGSTRHPQGARGVAVCKGQKTKDDALVVAGRATLLRARAIPPEADTDVTDIHHVDMILANRSSRAATRATGSRTSTKRS
jgi:hypothetical protein